MATVRYTIANGQILAEKRAGSRKLYRSDALGSTVALYDNSQAKTDTFTYWPYGETRTSSGSTGTKYKYVGALCCREQADGGIYMRARTQRAGDGRWLTVDSLWPFTSPYSYASESPATINDPSGHGPKCRLVYSCSYATIFGSPTVEWFCELCLEQFIGGTWTTKKCWPAGSGGRNGANRIPQGCFCFSRPTWISKAADGAVWGQGKVVMSLKPCPEDESRLRRECPDRDFHPGSFTIHGGGEVNRYVTSGCITLLTGDVEELKKMISGCSNRNGRFDVIAK